MKKSILIGIALSTIANIGVAASEVKSVKSNGTNDGVPSCLVTCTSGYDSAFLKKNGTWYHGLLGAMGSKYDSWSVEQVAAAICKISG